MPTPEPAAFNSLDSIAAPDDGFSYTPSDSTWIVDPEGNSVVARAITVGASGAVQVTFLNGKTRVLPAACFPVGARVSMKIKKIWATNTTATGIVVWL